MDFDPLVANDGRLRILTALARGASVGGREFVSLRSATRLSDGNLATHARKLHSAGLISVEKRIRAGRSLTTYQLTARGREALGAHARRLQEALRSGDGEIVPSPIPVDPVPAHESSDWVD